MFQKMLKVILVSAALIVAANSNASFLRLNQALILKNDTATALTFCALGIKPAVLKVNAHGEAKAKIFIGNLRQPAYYFKGQTSVHSIQLPGETTHFNDTVTITISGSVDHPTAALETPSNYQAW